jgi:C-terminal processing protease CtpA/Prc
MLEKFLLCFFSGFFLYLLSSPAFSADLLKKDSADKALSDADKIYGLSRIWQEANYNFAFFDLVPSLDWEQAYKDYIPSVMASKSTEEYYLVLQKFCALLKDGHTIVVPPLQVKESLNLDVPEIELINPGKKIFVINMNKDLKESIPRGSEILQINHIPLEEYLNSEIFPYISSSTEHYLWEKGTERLLIGPSGSEVFITFITPEGQTEELGVIRNSLKAKGSWAYDRKEHKKLLEFRWLDNNIAFISMNSFADKKIIEEFKACLPELEKSRGLIIDLRYNGGGSSDTGNEIIKYLTDAPFKDVAWKTPEHIASFKAWGAMAENLTPQQLTTLDDSTLKFLEKCKIYYKSHGWYEGESEEIMPHSGTLTVPIVVLTGHNTFSSAENFLVVLDKIKRATFVGQKTAGSTGQPLTIELPGGGQAYICTRRVLYSDGSDFVGYGITPHVSAEPALDDILNGRDTILEKGIEVLKEKMAGE